MSDDDIACVRVCVWPLSTQEQQEKSGSRATSTPWSNNGEFCPPPLGNVGDDNDAGESEKVH
jgi:hypothetical protein